MKRIFLLVIDGFGVGAAPDAKEYGDVGSNTFLNLEKKHGMNIPFLSRLGLKNMDGLNLKNDEKLIGSYARLQEVSKGKDTTTGHLEMMRVITKTPSPTFPNGFPMEVTKKLEKAFGVGILGNKVASGTQIIDELGAEHLKTKKPIVYTSADSVLQIAAHTDIYPLEKLYELCVKARKIMKGKYAVGRVIARPFHTEDGVFARINDGRKDFALELKADNTLSVLSKNGLKVVAVGKINDIFNGTGITNTYPCHNNADAIKLVFDIAKKEFSGLVFVNLVDTDMLFGHRNDMKGYAECIENIDRNLAKFVPKMGKDDVLLVTGDHGNDPTTPSTDHSREYVPLLIYSKAFRAGLNLGTIKGFDTIGKLIESYFHLSKEKSVIQEILWKN